MIPKGLKVGDTFDDFGQTYEVTKVVGENYESRWVGATPPKALVSTDNNVKNEEKTDYNALSYAQLKKICAEKGLDAKGTKADLIERLEK